MQRQEGLKLRFLEDTIPGIVLVVGLLAAGVVLFLAHSDHQQRAELVAKVRKQVAAMNRQTPKLVDRNAQLYLTRVTWSEKTGVQYRLEFATLASGDWQAVWSENLKRAVTRHFCANLLMGGIDDIGGASFRYVAEDGRLLLSFRLHRSDCAGVQ